MATATLVSTAAVLPSLEEQAGALLAWKDTLPDKQVLQSWGNKTWPCNWRGISCSSTQAKRPVITRISLYITCGGVPFCDL